jgi:hypothetical protein
MVFVKDNPVSCAEMKIGSFKSGSWQALSPSEPLFFEPAGISFSNLFAHDELQILPPILASGLTWQSSASYGGITQ